jgi:extracellular elastinolytic metalloproteinase
MPQAVFNFQTNNFRNGGLGKDRVTISVQDNGGIDDAPFTMPPECVLSFSLS